MRRFKLQVLALTCFALESITLSAPAGAQISTFSAYLSATTTEYAAAVGRPVTSGALDFYDTELFVAGARNVLGTWGTGDAGAVNRPTNIGSSTAMFATQLGEEVDLFGRGSDIVLGRYNEFNIFSVDVGHLYSTVFSPFTLLSFNFTVFGFGTGTGNTTISQVFAITAPTAVAGVQNPRLQTLTFDSRWRNMSNVWWSQANGSGSAHQFTNVSASLVPEPGTYALTFVGLVGLFWVRNRRRSIH